MSTLAVTPAAAVPPAPRVPAAAPRAALLAPLRTPAYRLLWTGRLISLVGDAFQLVVLPALVLDLTGRPSGLGTVLMAQAIPRALLLLAGGVLTDRFSPRSVMVASNLAQAVIVATLLVPAGAGTLSLWHVYLYAVAFGAVSAFFLPASTSVVPDLLPRGQVRAGNALALVTGNLTRFAVPPLAGIVIAAAGRPVAFAVNAASFLIAALLFWRLPPAEHQSSAAPGAPRSIGAWNQVREGIAAARQDREVWLAIMLSTVFWFGYAGAVFVGLPALAKLTYGLGDAGVGLLLGASGAGALLGAVVAGGARAVPRASRTACAAVTLGGAALLLAGLAPALSLAIACLVLSGALGSACAVILLSLVQTRAHEAARGRVMSLMTLGVFGSAPFSYAAAGVAADAVGPRVLLVAAGAIIALAGAAALLHRTADHSLPSPA